MSSRTPIRAVAKLKWELGSVRPVSLIVFMRTEDRALKIEQGYRPNHADPIGNHGQGATTRAPTAPLSTSFLRRVSTKIPCWGCEALGYNVVNVRICTGKPIKI